MKTTVLGSYALLAYFEKEEGWDTVAQLLADAAADRCRLCGCVVNWGEVPSYQTVFSSETVGTEKSLAISLIFPRSRYLWANLLKMHQRFPDFLTSLQT